MGLVADAGAAAVVEDVVVVDSYQQSLLPLNFGLKHLYVCNQFPEIT